MAFKGLRSTRFAGEREMFRLIRYRGSLPWQLNVVDGNVEATAVEALACYLFDNDKTELML